MVFFKSAQWYPFKLNCLPSFACLQICKQGAKVIFQNKLNVRCIRFSFLTFVEYKVLVTYMLFKYTNL